MNQLMQLGLVFGGQSSEHAISILSAKNINRALLSLAGVSHLLYIGKNGLWYYLNSMDELQNFNPDRAIEISLSKSSKGLAIRTVQDFKNLGFLNIIFPIVHGQQGEDGSLQGYLDTLGIAYVGCDTRASLLCYDKGLCKTLLRQAGLPLMPDFIVSQEKTLDYPWVREHLGLPFIVKPSCSGSSMGLSLVSNELEYSKALILAFGHSREVLLEKYLKVKELECAVLGNETLSVSDAGELIKSSALYDYKAKYAHDSKVYLEIPAKIDEKTQNLIKTYAKSCFRTLNCQGMARIDFFLDEFNALYINEINTHPGFTDISMYPKLMAANDVPLPALLENLINLAWARQIAKDKALVTQDF